MSLANETPDDLFLDEQGLLQVATSCIAYGIHVSIGLTVLYLTITSPKSRRVSWLLVAYVCTLLVCGTLLVATTIQPAIKAFVRNREFPGGPMAFLMADFSDPIETLGDTAYSLASLLTDALLLYRLKVIWERHWIVLVLPSIAYLAEIAITILALFQSAKPGASLWVKTAINVYIPYWSLGIANNASMTLLIVFRMLMMRKAISRVLNAKDLKVYLSISAMLVESAALYSVFGIVYIILFARNSPVQFPINGILDQVACIAPELIVMRVVLGRTWSSDTSSLLTGTEVCFSSGGIEKSEGSFTSSTSSRTRVQRNLVSDSDLRRDLV